MPACSLQLARRDARVGAPQKLFDALCLGGRLKTSLQPRFIGLHSTTSLPRNTIHTVHCLSLRQHGIVHRSQRVVQAALSSPSKPMSGCYPWLVVWCGAQVSTVWLYNRRGLGHGHCFGCSLPSFLFLFSSSSFGVRSHPSFFSLLLLLRLHFFCYRLSRLAFSSRLSLAKNQSILYRR